MIKGPLKWHGGKSYLAKRIVGLMPSHLHYVEPYGGGLSVLLAKDPIGVSEVVNDLDGALINFWRVLQRPSLFERLHRRLQATPFAEEEWLEAESASADPVYRATAFFIRCRQSLAGRMDTFAPLSRTRTRRGMNEQASAWLQTVDGLPEVHARLRRVVILCRPALDVITSQDGPDTLFYCDPPYLHRTRSSPTVFQQYEMSDLDHKELLDLACRCQGVVMLSGYRSVMYDRVLSKWRRYEFELPNNAAGGKSKRRMVECLWINR